MVAIFGTIHIFNFYQCQSAQLNPKPFIILSILQFLSVYP
jgi:hypothetical protein